MKTIIPNPENLEVLKSKIKEGGFSNLHVLADFDRTLTYAFVDGVKIPSVISMLRDGKYLASGYAEKAHALFDKYHPIEMDLDISLVDKKKAMQEWWETHFKLLVESGLTRDDLEDIVQDGPVRLREGIPEFLDFLYEQNIPLVILSSCGCGDAIPLFFKKIGKDYSNIVHVTNRFNWDENGRAISVKGLVIHCMNKDETILKEMPEVYGLIKDRRNVLLLGDSVGDLGMVEGFEYDNLLKAGFLNFDVDKSRKVYEENFDVILEGDGDFSYINGLIRDLG